MTHTHHAPVNKDAVAQNADRCDVLKCDLKQVVGVLSAHAQERSESRGHIQMITHQHTPFPPGDTFPLFHPLFHPPSHPSCPLPLQPLFPPFKNKIRVRCTVSNEPAAKGIPLHVRDPVGRSFVRNVLHHYILHATTHLRTAKRGNHNNKTPQQAHMNVQGNNGETLAS